MPKRRVAYLVHDLTDLTQTIKIGQRELVSYVRNEKGCRVNNTSLNRINEREVSTTDQNGHEIIIEGLFD